MSVVLFRGGGGGGGRGGGRNLMLFMVCIYDCLMIVLTGECWYQSREHDLYNYVWERGEQICS